MFFAALIAFGTCLCFILFIYIFFKIMYYIIFFTSNTSSTFQDETITGIFQWSGKQQLTKYDMVVAMSKALSLSHNVIPDPNAVPGALRPYDAELDRSRLENLGISHHIDFEVGIKECLLPWVK